MKKQVNDTNWAGFDTLLRLWRLCVLAVFSISRATGSNAQTTVSYVQSWTATAPEPNPNNLIVRPLSDAKMVTAYYDGLGRPIQAVAKQGSLETSSGNNVDLVSVTGYDVMGRKNADFLPYVAVTADGSYKTDASTAQPNYYTNYGNPYFGQGESGSNAHTQVNFELTPLNRPLLSMAPGNSWVGAARGMQPGYFTNTANDSVIIWTVTNNGVGVFGSYAATGYYPPGTLVKNSSTDEAGHQVLEFKDLDGQVILKKVGLTSTDNGSGTGYPGWLCTYYIYDLLYNLRCVIQPDGVQVLDQTSWSFAATPALLSQQCFRYEYDQRNRPVMKQLPGAGAVYMVYDAVDRLVMTQDANLRALTKWIVTVYDPLNRPIETGLLTDATPFATELSNAYTSTSYPSTASNFELLTQTFYDSYSSWVNGTGISSSLNGTYFGTNLVTSYNVTPVYAQAVVASSQTQGLVTGTMEKVIGTTSQYLYTVRLYDSFARVLQVQHINVTGGQDVVTTQYDWSGHPLRIVEGRQKMGNTAQTHQVVTKYSYDALNRQRVIYKNIDQSSADQLIDSMQYDNLGHLRAKYLGNLVDSLVYDYNIRGWTIGINRNYVGATTTHYFGMELGYDKRTSVSTTTYATAQFNGNITGYIWKGAGDGINRKYDFNYDNANRFLGANYLQDAGSGVWNTAIMDYTVGNVGYDPNGNLLTLNQRGYQFGQATSALIDQLKYNYFGNSNQLGQVVDQSNNPNSKLGDFHTPSPAGGYKYQYDGNGNLSLDSNKSIGLIHYNYLNLPDSIAFTGKGYIKYTYDAGGTKLVKTTIDNPASKATMTTYLGGTVYQRSAAVPTGANPVGGTDTLQFITHEEGRARWAYHNYTTVTPGYRMEYDFFEKDYLGNTRMVLTQERDTTNYWASWEQHYRGVESQLFGNIASTCVAWTSMPNYTSIPNNLRFGIWSPNDSVSKVDYNGSTGQTTGVNLLLKVMAGDTITPGVQCYYVNNTITSTNSSFSSVLQSLATSIVATPTGAAEGTVAGFSASGSPVYSAVNSFLTSKDQAPPSGYPKAYLNWILLDDQFNYVPSASGSIAVASSTHPANQFNTIAAGGPVVMPKNGYLYVWVSNETQGWDVYFDNFTVQYKQGPVLEENHYYPFGLTMSGISDKAVKLNYAENKYRFNQGSELQSKEFSDGSGLEMYETPLRELDPQLGRWWQIDSKPDYAQSLYSSMGDNPVLHNDPLGDSGTLPWPMQVSQSSPTNSQTLIPLGGGDNGDNSSGGGSGTGSSSSGQNSAKSGDKKGAWRSPKQLFGISTTDKTLTAHHHWGNSLVGELTWDSYTGVKAGTEGVVTIDVGTNKGKFEGSQVNFLDGEAGVDKDLNVMAGKNLGFFEFHGTAAGSFGDKAGLGESHPTGEHTVAGNEITFKPGILEKAMMTAAAPAAILDNLAAEAGAALAAKAIQFLAPSL